MQNAAVGRRICKTWGILCEGGNAVAGTGTKRATEAPRSYKSGVVVALTAAELRSAWTGEGARPHTI